MRSCDAPITLAQSRPNDGTQSRPARMADPRRSVDRPGSRSPECNRTLGHAEPAPDRRFDDAGSGTTALPPVAFPALPSALPLESPGQSPRRCRPTGSRGFARSRRAEDRMARAPAEGRDRLVKVEAAVAVLERRPAGEDATLRPYDPRSGAVDGTGTAGAGPSGRSGALRFRSGQDRGAGPCRQSTRPVRKKRGYEPAWSASFPRRRSSLRTTVRGVLAQLSAYGAQS
jgi:hypothetical protein